MNNIENELWTNGAYTVYGHIEWIPSNKVGPWVISKTPMLIGYCTKSQYPQVKKVGEGVDWPLYHTKEDYKRRKPQFRTIEQIRNEKLINILQQSI